MLICCRLQKFCWGNKVIFSVQLRLECTKRLVYGIWNHHFLCGLSARCAWRVNYSCQSLCRQQCRGLFSPVILITPHEPVSLGDTSLSLSLSEVPIPTATSSSRYLKDLSTWRRYRHTPLATSRSSDTNFPSTRTTNGSLRFRENAPDDSILESFQEVLQDVSST